MSTATPRERLTASACHCEQDLRAWLDEWESTGRFPAREACADPLDWLTARLRTAAIVLRQAPHARVRPDVLAALRAQVRRARGALDGVAQASRLLRDP